MQAYVRTRAHAAAAVVVCAVLGGCGASPPSEHDIDGLPRLTATASTRIGSVDDPDTGFSRLGGVDVDANGNIYALEVQDNQIRVYAPDSRVIHRIGGRGSGPGEFQGAPRFGIRGDTLWTYDTGAGRITLFDLAGRVLSTGPTHGLQIPLPGRYGYVIPWQMRADGLFTGWFARVSYNRDLPPTGVEPGDPLPVPHVVFDAAGTVVDTVGWLPSPPPRMVPPPGNDRGRFRSITVGSRPVRVPDPPSTLPTWLAVPDGYVTVDVPYATGSTETATFSVTRIGLAGDTIYHRVLTYRPTRYTAEDLDSVAARGARGTGPGPAPSMSDGDRHAVVNSLREALQFPEFRLPIQHPWLAQDEGVWLAREDSDATVTRWILLDPVGRTRGELHLPRRLRPLWSHGNVFWAAELDEFDVPWLVRYEITG